MLEDFQLSRAELIGYTGPHAETKPAAISLWREFMARHLTPSFSP